MNTSCILISITLKCINNQEVLSYILLDFVQIRMKTIIAKLWCAYVRLYVGECRLHRLRVNSERARARWLACTYSAAPVARTLSVSICCGPRRCNVRTRQLHNISTTWTRYYISGHTRTAWHTHVFQCPMCAHKAPNWLWIMILCCMHFERSDACRNINPDPSDCNPDTAVTQTVYEIKTNITVGAVERRRPADIFNPHMQLLLRNERRRIRPP